MILHTSHSELEKLVIPRDLERIAHDLGRAYADLTYNGRWFSPTREAIDAFVAHDPAAGYGRGAAEAVQGRLPRRRAAVAAGARCQRGSAAGAARRHGPAVAARRLRRGRHVRGSLMAHLWSGRFAGDPGRRALRVRIVVPFRPAAVRGRRAREPGVGGGSGARRRPVRGGRRRDRTRTRGDPRRTATRDPAFVNDGRTATRTSTRSSSASWWRASAMPAGGCTRAARATNRSPSICAST